MNANPKSRDFSGGSKGPNPFFENIRARARSANARLRGRRSRESRLIDESATDADVISEGIKEIEAKERDRKRIRQTSRLSWILLALGVVILIVCLTLLARSPSSDQLTLIEKNINDVSIEVTTLNRRIDSLFVAIGGRGVLSVEKWTSGVFPEGQSVCPEVSAGPSAPCGLTSLPEGSSRSLPDVLSDMDAGPAVVLIVGGHDRTPLSTEARRRFGTNIQLAQARAISMQKAIEESLKGKNTPRLEYIAIPRGAANYESLVKEDRRVVVSVFRVGEK